MNFSAWAIRKPIPSILLFGLLTVAGCLGFKVLPVQDFPDMDLPMVTVAAMLPGATPSTLETEVTRKIEDAVATVSGIKHITSTVNDGASTTMVEFNLEKDVQEAVNDVRNAVDGIRSELPAEMPAPIVSRVTTVGGAVITFAVESNGMDEADLSWFVDNEISKALLSVDGVGQVMRLGGITREVRVELDQTKLLALGITAGEISSVIRSVQQEAPGGRTDIGGLEQSVRTVGTVRDAADVAKLTVPLADGRSLRLDAVATILDAAAERRQVALLDGKPAVTFQVMRARGASEIAVAEGARIKLTEVAKLHPSVTIREVGTIIEPIIQNYDAAMYALYEGAFLAVVVVWLFLRDRRATFISAVALPLSVIPTFAVMSLLGFQLNTITLLALTLVVGVLVDDAIVEVENIERHLVGGKNPRDAALEGAEEIGLAVIATSLTLVAVFLPTAAMSGIVGMFFRQFGWTAAIAVLFSLLVARLLTPMMAAYLLKPKAPAERPDGRIMVNYLKAVRACLAHPAKTVVAAAAFLAASVLVGSLLSVTFMAADDVDQIAVNVELPPGSSLEDTLGSAERTRRIAAGIAEVRCIYTTIGAGGSGDFGSADSAGEVRKATLTLQLPPAGERERSQQQIEAILREEMKAIPGVRITVGGGGMGEKVSLVLAGDDMSSLLATANQVMAELRTLPNLGNILSLASLQRPEVIVRPDFAKAAELGVTASSLGDAVRVATTGDYDQDLPRLNLSTRQISIRTQLAPDQRGRLEVIKSLRVPGKGGAVPLGQVAEVSIEGGPTQINRFDRSRNVTIDIEAQGRPTGDILAEIDRLPSLQRLPADVHRIESGEAENLSELFGSFGLAMAIGVFCIYAVLVLLFHDFLQPVTILAALPLSLGGAFCALALFGHGLSMPSLIGMVMLMGIVTKNSILLVEYAIMARRDFGLGRTEAIIDACHKRARPIIMTTVAMVAGMLPMTFGLTSSFRAPMALAVIGGLITSTGLSLLVVPVLFEVVDEFKIRARHRLGLVSAGAANPSLL
ncbi:Multidrug resistance protein MdtC [Lacunisphaera limnophila]|uniref:Multidrug resistance protein MdtC n=1 Tax=Lacunisphaera limnophila TaxID=1838286 RepID=A0A1D8AS39_9BACT|nr:efflux RND transporter permease subunit [Lacunisphaera limnophila]AOS43714.1 Multidrug resistance protein MdtC [Lacunisphaera limnophila]